jgi:translation initiation factor 1
MSTSNPQSESETPGFNNNPFGNIPVPERSDSGPKQDGLPQPLVAKTPRKNRGRVDIQRQTGGRGGKTVTVIKGFVGIGLQEKEELARAIRKTCGTGGTVKDGQIEIHGDKREEVARILSEAGFRPVFAGG